MGMVIGLKPDRIETYKRLHAETWPEILAKISECNITNYSIFLREPTRARRTGGPSACPARSRSPRGRTASGGP
jgi:hypothetical protein